jgi:hypothetical protein
LQRVLKYLLIEVFSILFISSLLLGGVVSANTAGLAVIHGDGKQTIKTVTFEGVLFSAADLLRSSGLTNSIASGSSGQTVYMIDGEGNPKSRVVKDGKDYIWALYVFKNGRWEYSPTGANKITVNDGAVLAWLWQQQGQAVDFPSVSIPDMNFYIASGRISSPIPAESAEVLSTDTAKKTPGQTNGGAGWGYAIFAIILMALGIILLDRLRPRYNRRK